MTFIDGLVTGVVGTILTAGVLAPLFDSGDNRHFCACGEQKVNGKCPLESGPLPKEPQTMSVCKKGIVGYLNCACEHCRKMEVSDLRYENAILLEVLEAAKKVRERISINGGLGEYKGGPTFCLKDFDDALARARQAGIGE